MYKLVRESKLPKFLKVLIYTLLTITCVYWLGMFVYKFLNGLRKLIHWVTESRNWWTFIVCVLILGVGIVLAGQFYFGLNPIGNFHLWFLEQIEVVKNWLMEIVESVLK